MSGPATVPDRERFRRMAAKSVAVRRSRVYLSADEASALVDAYQLLRSIARRSKIRDLVPPENDEAPAESAAGAGLGV